MHSTVLKHVCQVCKESYCVLLSTCNEPFVETMFVMLGDMCGGCVRRIVCSHKQRFLTQAGPMAMLVLELQTPQMHR